MWARRDRLPRGYGELSAAEGGSVGEEDGVERVEGVGGRLVLLVGGCLKLKRWLLVRRSVCG